MEMYAYITTSQVQRLEDDMLMFTPLVSSQSTQFVEIKALKTMKLYDINHRAMDQFTNPSKPALEHSDSQQMHKVQIDPDNRLSTQYKEILSYQDIITEVPGQYN